MFKTSIITLRESTTAEPHVNFFSKNIISTTGISQLIVTSGHYTVIAKALDRE